MLRQAASLLLLLLLLFILNLVDNIFFIYILYDLKLNLELYLDKYLLGGSQYPGLNPVIKY